MTTREVALEVLGVPFVVESDDESMHDLVRVLWEPFAVAQRAPDAYRFVVEAADARWILWSGTEPVARGQARDPWIFAVMLRNLLTIEAVAASRSRTIPLHASVAERDGFVLVLSGPPEAGKTTLLLELLERGWRYVSDDLAPIDRGGGAARVFPKPLQVRDARRWQEWAGAWRVPDWLPAPETTALLPANAFVRSGSDSYRPGAVVFSRYEAGQKPRLERLSAAETAAACVDNLQDLRAAAPGDLAGMTAWTRGARGLRAVYGSTAEALDLLATGLRDLQKLE